MSNEIKVFFIGSDHAGYELKEKLLQYMQKIHPLRAVINLGCFSEVNCDYPDIVKDFKKQINKIKKDINYDKPVGLFVCGSGIGMSIAANKVKNIRAAVCNDLETVFSAKLHNNINVLCLGARIFKNETDAMRILDAFFKLEFENIPRHLKRIQKLNKM